MVQCIFVVGIIVIGITVIGPPKETSFQMRFHSISGCDSTCAISRVFYTTTSTNTVKQMFLAMYNSRTAAFLIPKIHHKSEARPPLSTTNNSLYTAPLMQSLLASSRMAGHSGASTTRASEQLTP